MLCEGKFDVVDPRQRDSTKFLHEVARDLHVHERVVAALDHEERRRVEVDTVIGRHAPKEPGVLLVRLLHHAPFEQDLQSPPEPAPVGLVAGHLEHAVERDRAAHAPVVDARDVLGTPGRIVRAQRQQRRELTAR